MSNPVRLKLRMRAITLYNHLVNKMTEPSAASRERVESPGDVVVREYLRSMLAIFRECHDMRKRVCGCNSLLARITDPNSKISGDYWCDKEYATKKKQVDNAAASKDPTKFSKIYEVVLMQALPIGNPLVHQRDLRILDVCMASGWFGNWVISNNRTARYRGFSLPKGLGRHGLNDKDGDKSDSLEHSLHRIELKWVDITMLAGEDGVSEPAELKAYSGSNALSLESHFDGQDSNLVVAEGEILDGYLKHTIGEKEAKSIRLDCSKMAIALRRIKSGGIFIMLLHRLDRWRTLQTIKAFKDFADVTVNNEVRAA